jgi:hypothetical protein
MKKAILIAATFLAPCGCAAHKTTTLEPAPRKDDSGSSTTSSSTTPGTEHSMTPGPGLLTPSATGSVITSIDSNSNTVLKVRADHLAQPANLDPSLTTYVVWIRPRVGGDFMNVGQLVMSADRGGALQTSTPHTNFDVLLTAEATATAQQPSKFVVLQAQASRP